MHISTVDRISKIADSEAEVLRRTTEQCITSVPRVDSSFKDNTWPSRYIMVFIIIPCLYQVLSVQAHQRPITVMATEGGRIVSGSQDFTLKVGTLILHLVILTLGQHFFIFCFTGAPTLISGEMK